MTKTENKVTDRRAKARFTIRRELRYKLLVDNSVVEAGVGQTVDIGSGGVAFRAGRALTPGAFLELSISWPVLLEQNCPMRLNVFGRVLRSTGDVVACTIDKYEFRTQARTVGNTFAVRSDAMLERWAEGVLREAKTSAAGF